jgi:hypothetical protein
VIAGLTLVKAIEGDDLCRRNQKVAPLTQNILQLDIQIQDGFSKSITWVGVIQWSWKSAGPDHSLPGIVYYLYILGKPAQPQPHTLFL